MGLIMSAVSVLLMWIASNVLAAGPIGALHRLLWLVLHDGAEAPNRTEHRHWRCSRRFSAPVIGWAVVTGTTPAGCVDPLRDHLLLDPPTFLGAEPGRT